MTPDSVEIDSGLWFAPTKNAHPVAVQERRDPKVSRAMNQYLLLITILHFKRKVLERYNAWIIKIDGDVDIVKTKRF